MPVFMAIARVRPVHWTSADSAPDGHPPSDQVSQQLPTWTASPPVGCYRPQSQSSFIIITQPESLYSSDHATEGEDEST